MFVWSLHPIAVEGTEDLDEGTWNARSEDMSTELRHNPQNYVVVDCQPTTPNLRSMMRRPGMPSWPRNKPSTMIRTQILSARTSKILLQFTYLMFRHLSCNRWTSLPDRIPVFLQNRSHQNFLKRPLEEQRQSVRLSLDNLAGLGPWFGVRKRMSQEGNLIGFWDDFEGTLG